MLGVIFAMGMSSTGFAAEIIAHRGASFDAPENTLRSVRLAWEQNADAVECDVYLSKDGKIVLMHDRTPKRYGGPDRPVASMTWEELSLLDVGAWKGTQFQGEKVPLLSDVLKTIPEGKRLFIEIKTGPEIVPELKRVLTEAARPADQTAIICFNSQVIARTVEELPQLQSYWLVSMKDKNQPPVDVNHVIATARKLRAHGVDIGGDTKLIDESFVNSLHNARIPCYVWTVNDPAEAKRLANLGVLGITTDKPQLLRTEKIGEISITPKSQSTLSN